MKTHLLILMCALLGDPSATPEKGVLPTELEKQGQAFVEMLAKEDFTEAEKKFDEVMKKALPADKLQKTWEAITKKLGPFKEQTRVRTEKKDKYDIVIVTIKFEKLALDARITFTRDRQITGLFFTPAPSSTPYQPPDYVNQDVFEEKEVVVGDGEWALPGTLSLPKGDGPFPAVVLVHGSGPNDRDETVLANKPFRDLAWGLASRGIAVLRYEKRTREHGGKLGTSGQPLTVKEEVLDDALVAAQLLRETPKVDPKRVYLLGHSLGAMMAPRLGQLDPKLAGLILLAGPTRPLEDLVLEQFTYLYSLKGMLSDEDKAELEKIKKQVERVKDPSLTADAPAEELPLGAPAMYWLALRDYRPGEVAARIKQPLLILHGERDYQVTMEDFAGWQKAMADRKNVVLKSYPALNHLFMEGEGKAKPAEYHKAGHVARTVIEDIAQWIKER